ncbi:hypothetical protein XA68_16059 [Ophiocordyceps unilateralis]|uniref:Uncharacterized protein n=1 Tax=Ophiocordyceps unilateralis TaxID=268505 RepID=A0A2A9P5F8_OPHUN|nr:hypothetical protein XA68_16059 [Ophiocordyceps unilateralis]
MPPYSSIFVNAHVPTSVSPNRARINTQPTANLDTRPALAADDKCCVANPDFASSNTDRYPSQSSLTGNSFMSRSSLDPLSPSRSQYAGLAADSTLQRQPPLNPGPVSASPSATLVLPGRATASDASLRGFVSPLGSGGLSHTVAQRLPSTPSAGVMAAPRSASSSVGLEPAFAPNHDALFRTEPPTVPAGGHSCPTFPSASICNASEIAPSTLVEVGGSVPSATTLPPQSSARWSFGSGNRPVLLPRLSRSVSDDAVASSQYACSTSHSLRQQLSFLIEAWMADRESCGLEKQAAEQELRRLRNALRSDHENWTSDRMAMGRQLDTLRAQVHGLELEIAALKTATAPNASGDNTQSPRTGQQHPGGVYGLAGNSSLSDPDEPAATTLSSNPSQQSNSSRAYVFSPPIGSTGAPRRAHFATPGSSRTSPSAAPAPSHAAQEPDLGQQPRLSVTTDFMDPLGLNGFGAVPVIDVQELDPKLDGIPIKANAVQKWTFSTAPNQRQAASGARVGHGISICRTRRQSTTQNRRSMDRGRISRERQTSRDQTLQVLAVEESRRLTMHAGHTPNHSISLIPTMTTVGGDSDGGMTHSIDAPSDVGVGQEATHEPLFAPDHDGHESPKDGEDDGKEPLGPCDDASLKGPLMVKNIPAQDDLFFAQLDQKLESVISSGEDALPSVLRTPSPAEPAAPPVGSRPVAVQASLGLDGAHELAVEVDEGAADDDKDIEPDVPLRLRSTANFGAPFGST